MAQGSNFWDRKYRTPSFVYGRQPNRFLVDVAPALLGSGARVLSLGEGEGRNAVWMARQGWSVTAVDYSREALAKLDEFARRCGVEIEIHRADAVQFDAGAERWDSVVLLHIHLAPERRRRLHEKVVRALRPGGVLLLEMLRCEQQAQPTGGPERRELLYTADELQRDFGTLHICRLVEEDWSIDAGEHQGMTSVVNLVATKEWG